MAGDMKEGCGSKNVKCSLLSAKQ